MRGLLFPTVALFILATAELKHAHKDNNLEIVHQWNLLDYGFPTARHRQMAITNGNMEPANGIPIDVAPFYSANGKTRIFTTIPRFQTGVPYTLATITERRGDTGPLLQAYPSYDWHNSHGANCDGITSAFRVAITECNQMWVIDSGMIAGVQHCPPQLLVFDLNSDKLVLRFRFDTTVYTPVASLLITPIVVVRDPPPLGRCQRSMVYIADVTHHGIVVYDQQQNMAWRVENKYMYPDPDFGTHTIAGENFTLMDGILGMSADKQDLYFHPMATDMEYAVPLTALNDRNNWVNHSAAMPEVFRALGSRGSECAAEAMDSRGNLYCVTFNPIRLISWNVNTPYTPKNFREISTDEQILQFISGMKVVKNMTGKEELWMFSNRFQKIAAGTLDANEVNFRILKRPLDDVQNGIDVEISNKDLTSRLVFN